jgi:hypothetical protein
MRRRRHASRDEFAGRLDPDANEHHRADDVVVEHTTR